MTSETPTSGTTDLGPAITVVATFSEPVQAGTINFSLKNSAGTTVAANVAYYPATLTAILTPTSPLPASTKYTASVTGAQDLEGDSMTAPATWSFTTAAAAGVTAGLVAEWNFNEDSGTTTADDTGNGHTGTLVGASWASGLVGPGPYALSFNSSNDARVVVPDSPSLEFTATQSFSLSAWVYVPSLPNGYEGIVTKSRDVGNDYGIWINPSNQWLVSGGAGNQNLVGSNVIIGWSLVTEKSRTGPQERASSTLTASRLQVARPSNPTGLATCG